MRFEDLLKKPLHEMSDEELEQLIHDIEEVRVKALESPQKKKRSRKLKAEDVFEGVSL